MGALVLEHEGTLERFAGDGMMIFFNDPLPIDEPAEHAVRMALAMQEAFVPLATHWQKRGYELASASASRRATRRSARSASRGAWTTRAIGTVTNLAARLCGEAKAGQVLIDRKIMAALDDAFEVDAARAARPSRATRSRCRRSRSRADMASKRRRIPDPAAAKLAAARKERKDALEQQASTAAILKVIRRSPGDAQPVFDEIVRRALRLVEGHSALVLRLSDGMLHLAAHSSTGASGDDALKRFYPQPIKGVFLHGRAIRSRRPYSVADTEKVPASMTSVKSMARQRGYRSLLVVPMLRDGAPIGSIGVSRKQPGEFSKQQIRTLEAFADQAVIAIENVRLFHETREALEQQTATADILRVIAGSPASVQPVFEAILDKATDLCKAQLGLLFLLSGATWRMVSHRGASPEAQESHRSFQAGPNTGLGRMLRERKPVHIEDLVADAATVHRDPVRVATIEKLGARTFLAVPLLKDGAVIGAVVVYRKEVRPFSDAQIRLLSTFADQAVIAIENARLFNETREALQQQRASGDILRVIAASPTDVQPVFDAVCSSAARLCDAYDVLIWRREGDSQRVVGHYGPIPIPHQTLALSRATTSGRALLEKQPFQVPDLQAEEREYPEGAAFARELGFRTVLNVPLIRRTRLSASSRCAASMRGSSARRRSISSRYSPIRRRSRSRMCACSTRRRSRSSSRRPPRTSSKSSAARRPT